MCNNKNCSCNKRIENSCSESVIRKSCQITQTSNSCTYSYNVPCDNTSYTVCPKPPVCKPIQCPPRCDPCEKYRYSPCDLYEQTPCDKYKYNPCERPRCDPCDKYRCDPCERPRPCQQVCERPCPERYVPCEVSKCRYIYPSLYDLSLVDVSRYGNSCGRVAIVPPELACNPCLVRERCRSPCSPKRRCKSPCSPCGSPVRRRRHKKRCDCKACLRYNPCGGCEPCRIGGWCIRCEPCLFVVVPVEPYPIKNDYYVPYNRYGGFWQQNPFKC